MNTHQDILTKLFEKKSISGEVFREKLEII
jgi:hypothetical protein